MDGNRPLVEKLEDRLLLSASEPLDFPPQPPSSADLPSSIEVDYSLYQTLLQNFGSSGVTVLEGDLDRDGNVDYEDYKVCLQRFGQTITLDDPSPKAGPTVGPGPSVLYIDRDYDGYGVASPLGADADDNDASVNTYDSMIARYGTLESFLHHIGYAATRIFYIAKGGDNATGEANNPDRPFSSLSSTLKSQLLAGDVVVYRGGTYVQNYGIGVSYPTVAGTPGNPVVFLAMPGEKVVLDAAENGIDVPASHDLIFDGFVLDNSSAGRYGNGVYMYDSQNITFRNIESKNHTRGMMATHIDNVLFENCVVHDNPGSHGIYLNSHSRTSSDVTVRGSLVYRNAMHGIQFNGRVTGLTIEDNVVHSNTLGGVSLLMGVSNSAVRNNLIFNNDKQGIVFYLYNSGVDWVPTSDQDNNIVENNIVWIGRYEWENNGRAEPGNTEAIHFNDSTGTQDHTMYGNIIRNNILVTYCGPTFAFYQARFADNNTIEGNLIYRLGNSYSAGPNRILAIGPDYATTYGFDAFEAYSALFHDNTFADPGFADVSVSYFTDPDLFDFSRSVG